VRRRVSFKTVGCRLNQAETAQMAARFEAAGYEIRPFGEPCDICVVHTCAITRKAEKDCIRLARSAKKAPDRPLVVLAGCAAEVAGPRLLAESGADMLAGQSRKFDLPEILRGDGAAGPAEPPAPRFDATRALIKIQDGCDFRCAYCVVPQARGAPRSRPFAEVLDEVRRVADRGYCEIVLTGANIGCYESGARRLADILAALETMPAVRRVRVSSIEVSTTERAVIDHMADSAKLCRCLHIPLQSGDDGILSAMGRRYRVKDYRELVEYAVGRMPLLGLGTDLLTGFPGEDDAAFRNTKATVEALPFSNLHVFPFSPRPGTPAARMPHQVPESEKKRRAAALLRLGEEKRSAFAARFVGRPVSVLIERVAAGNLGTGWTGEYIEARVRRPGIATNRIEEFTPVSCAGETLQN
jgi:threonylcarbamoyladenosine tRNA methylthiotransferase MtaB